MAKFKDKRAALIWLDSVQDDIALAAANITRYTLPHAHALTDIEQLENLTSFVSHIEKINSTEINLSFYSSLKGLKEPIIADLKAHIQAVTVWMQPESNLSIQEKNQTRPNYVLLGLFMLLYLSGITLQILTTYFLPLPWVGEIVEWLNSNIVGEMLLENLSPLLMLAHGTVVQRFISWIIDKSQVLSRIVNSLAALKNVKPLSVGLGALLGLGIVALIFWKVSVPMIVFGLMGFAIRTCYKAYYMTPVVADKIVPAKVDVDEERPAGLYHEGLDSQAVTPIGPSPLNSPLPHAAAAPRSFANVKESKIINELKEVQTDIDAEEIKKAEAKLCMIREKIAAYSDQTEILQYVIPDQAITIHDFIKTLEDQVVAAKAANIAKLFTASVLDEKMLQAELPEEKTSQYKISIMMRALVSVMTDNKTTITAIANAYSLCSPDRRQVIAMGLAQIIYPLALTDPRRAAIINLLRIVPMPKASLFQQPNLTVIVVQSLIERDLKPEQFELKEIDQTPAYETNIYTDLSKEMPQRDKIVELLKGIVAVAGEASKKRYHDRIKELLGVIFTPGFVRTNIQLLLAGDCKIHVLRDICTYPAYAEAMVRHLANSDPAKIAPLVKSIFPSCFRENSVTIINPLVNYLWRMLARGEPIDPAILSLARPYFFDAKLTHTFTEPATASVTESAIPASTNKAPSHVDLLTTQGISAAAPRPSPAPPPLNSAEARAQSIVAEDSKFGMSLDV